MRKTRIDFSLPYDVQKMVTGVGQTISDVGRKLGSRRARREFQENAKDMSEGARQRLHHAADSLRIGSSRMTNKTRVSVRQRPLIMMFSALVAGVLLGRFFLGR